MAKTTRTTKTSASKSAKAAAPAKPRVKAAAPARMAEPSLAGWANDLVFNVREPKVAVSLRLDADVLRFFRGFGAGYQTRINEVLKAFMGARSDTPAVAAPAPRAKASTGRRATR